MKTGKDGIIEIPAQGERALILGHTGSGKSVFACVMLSMIEDSPIIIYDTKLEDVFLKLRNSKVVYDDNGLFDALDNENVDYIIYRPHVSLLAKPMELDALLYRHYEEFHSTPAYIDEIYTFHNNGRSGPGISALLTRGRSRGITTIMSSQRPTLFSRFCLTESQRYYVFHLTDLDDRKRVANVIPEFDKLARQPKFQYYYYENGQDNILLKPPVSLGPFLKKNYIQAIEPEPMRETPPDKARKLNWI